MPLTERLVADLIDQCGSYLYHDTRLVPFQSIITERRLRPPTDEERAASKAPKLRPRPYAVYFRLPMPRPAAEFRPEVVRESPFRVAIGSVDLHRFLIDEDRVCDWLMGRDKVDMPEFSDTFQQLPRWLCGGGGLFEAVESSLGEWVDAADDDTPKNVYASALRGTLAVRGVVSDGVEANLSHGMVSMLPSLAAAAATPKGWVPLGEIG